VVACAGLRIALQFYVDLRPRFYLSHSL